VAADIIDAGLVDIALFVTATFAAALVAGVAGFAFGLVAAAIWLHVLTPLQTTTLIVGFGLIVQGYAVWKLRRALKPARLLPFIAGAAFGLPIGVELLRLASPDALRISIGILLILFSLYSLGRSQFRPIQAGGRLADGVVGLLSGVMGGMTGLGGILPTIWSNVRGWPKDEQRAVFQPTGVAIFAGTALLLGGAGSIAMDTIRLFAIGLPALLAGSWLGLKVYGQLNEVGFRRIVLILLLVSGLALIAPLAMR
jgi:uncharacterized protein